jgi:CheY-like chemotaxis protein
MEVGRLAPRLAWHGTSVGVTMTDKPSSRRILVVEDEVMIAMLMEDMLADLGHEVVGPATKLEDGIELATSAEFDMAVLDVNLNGRHSRPIADILVQRGVPFVLATGYGTTGGEDVTQARHILKKPFTPEDLNIAIERVMPR